MADLKSSIISSATKILEKAARGETIDDNGKSPKEALYEMARNSKNTCY